MIIRRLLRMGVLLLFASGVWLYSVRGDALLLDMSNWMLCW